MKHIPQLQNYLVSAAAKYAQIEAPSYNPSTTLPNLYIPCIYPLASGGSGLGVVNVVLDDPSPW